MSRRRAAWVAALLAALLAGAQTAYWFWATGLVETGLHNWAAQQRALGWTVRAGERAWSGWPFRAAVRVGDVRLAGRLPGEAEEVAWQAEGVALRVDLWRPGVLHVLAEGAQRVRFGAGPEIPFGAGQLRVGFPLQAGPAPWVDVDIAALRADVSLADRNGTVRTESLSLANLSARGEMTASGLVMSARVATIGVPDWVAPGLGPRIDTARFQATMSGPLPLPSALRQAAAAWRDGGGKLEVRESQLRWGKLNVSGSFSLVLDAQLQPAGAGRLRISGHAEALDAMAAAGAMPARNAATAKGMLGLVARPTGPDGAPEIELPLTLQRRTLSIRQFQLVQFPALAWPGN